MGYQVDYASTSKQKPDFDFSFLRIAMFTVSFFLTFCMLVGTLWPRGREALGKLLFPGGAETAMAAAEVFVDELRNGEPLSDALENFCRDVIRHADIP